MGQHLYSVVDYNEIWFYWATPHASSADTAWHVNIDIIEKDKSSKRSLVLECPDKIRRHHKSLGQNPQEVALSPFIHCFVWFL